jgi:WD40 repeat protein
VLTIEWSCEPDTVGRRHVVRRLADGEIETDTPGLDGAYFGWGHSIDARFVGGYTKQEATVFSTSEMEPVVRLRRTKREELTGIAFHPSGKWLGITATDGTVKLYDTDTWAVAKTFTWNVGKLRSVAFSPDGTLAAVGSDSGKIVVWDVDV